MPRLPIRTTSPLEAKIRELENELFVVRDTLFHLVQPELGTLLRGQYGCKTFEEVSAWKERAVDEIIAFAMGGGESEKVVRLSMDDNRALCPLCLNGPDSPYYDGFSLPDGLRRHLLGTHRVHQCRVFRAAERMAQESAREAQAPASGGRWRPA